MKETITIGLVGSGGDGVVVMGSLLQRLAAAQGYFSQMPRYYGAQIRGGGSAVKLNLDGERLSLPRDELDILVCFDWEKYLEFEQELPLDIHSIVLYEEKPPATMNLPQRSCQAHFARKSQEVTGSAQNKNLVALGLLLKMLALPQDRVEKAIDSERGLRLLKGNLSALEAGRGLLPDMSFSRLHLLPAHESLPRPILHGNAAVAQGATRAGCRAFFGYPITPAIEVMEEMEKQLSRNGGAFLQAEDEIASAGLAIGASISGAKAMSSTSGPGLDLMTEMLGLSSSAEIPLVLVDVQRCGPSTGIPSKSEQSDLSHAIYGGHGDAPRVVIAPHDIEGCYRLAIESFNIAEQFQTPVILLSDQWLGQTTMAVGGEFLAKDYAIEERKKPVGAELSGYRRYRFTEDSVSPMSVVGDEGGVYQTTGLTHNEKGFPAFNFETNQKMHEKRMRKLMPLRKRDDLVNVFGDEKSDRGIITWGSTGQVVWETVRHLGLEQEIKVCVPELLWPLPDKVREFLRSVKRLLVVEMNYSGQMYRYLRSEAEMPKRTESYCRAGGRPFSRKELTGPIMETSK
ncbi:MAG: 2-oxoacid:acceptor oxidoreductase subunit alpha [Dehalococcoidia bacterium]|nr:2-oxoacid:acceptor oxidoreductase subunit alpha [Dehalococcoidia bacterium]